MALFTIEQVELIRRLRSSGITKDQVLQAFNELERLDAEFSRSVACDDTLLNSHFEFAYDCLSPSMVSNGNSHSSINHNAPNFTRTFTSMSESYYQFPFKPVDYYGSQNTSRTHCSSTNSSDGISEPEILTNECSINTLDISTKLQNELNVVSAPNETLLNSPSNELISQIHSKNALNCCFFPLDIQSEEHTELQELKKKGDIAVLNEIRNFVMAYNIKQTLIAEMTKMSQPYVSRFFRGDIQDMPDRTKDVFFMWYLTCKNNPLKLAQMCPNSGVKRMVSENGDLIPLKRERFTFKGAHLSVLERYYEQDPYPDTHVREIIVEDCNKAAEKAEWPLSDKDTVTLPVVNNWFNNRRKDAKKQMRLRHSSSSILVPQSCQATPLPSMVPVTYWSSCSVTSSFPIYQDLSNEISESDSSSASDRIIDSDHNLVIDIQEQDTCDVKQIL